MLWRSAGDAHQLWPSTAHLAVLLLLADHEQVLDQLIIHLGTLGLLNNLHVMVMDAPNASVFYDTDCSAGAL
jgi:hypothetical protein